MAKLKTAPFVEGLRGRTGNLVFRQTRYGTQLLDREAGHDPKTPAQLAARERMTQVGRAWKELSFEEAAAWNAWAKAQEPATTGQLAFSKLSMRLLHLDPSGQLPTLPPLAEFEGDSVGVSVSSKKGLAVFSADAPNRSGVVTELLVQALASRHRAAYLEKYRTQGFVAFGFEREHAVPLKAGCYAVAIRFVNQKTGQATEIVELGRVEVR